MTIGKGAELVLAAAFGLVLVVQANGAAPAVAVRQAAPPTAEQIEAAVAFAERQAERVNGASR